MKSLSGWCGRSGRKVWAMGVWGLALALVVGVFALPGQASAAAPGGGFTPLPPAGGAGPGGDAKDPGETPPSTAQECLERYMDNQERCLELWCQPASFFWFDWTDCQDSYLKKCILAVGKAYDCCLAGGPPCGGR